MLSLNLKLVVAYDGTNYFGWQKTKEGPSIEETLQKALEKILRHPLVLQAASRTDRGVHALGQVVNLHTTQPVSDFSKLLIGVNALLPKEIVVRDIKEAWPDFHPTLHVVSKTYTYGISYGKVQLPRDRLYFWHIHRELDFDLMKQGALLLTGTHDFLSFCNQKKNEEYLDHTRTIHRILITPLEEERLSISITGTHFLYKMVRNMVGTLAYLGCGKMTLEQVKEGLLSKDRTAMGVTAPAHGLTLEKVVYHGPSID